MNAHKVLLISKLAIVLVLLYTGGSTLLVDRNSAEFFTPASAGGSEREGGSGADASVEGGAEDFSEIVDHGGIFGIVERTTTESTSGPSVAMELGIELVGTVAGTPEVSRAIIKDTKTNKLGLYSIGQTVAGATIENIRLNAVDLMHNGKTKTLSLKAAQVEGRIGSSGSGGGKTDKSINTSAYLPGERINARPNTAAQSRAGYVEEILSKATIQPYSVNGEVEGLKVTGLDKIPAAASLGLKDGDIIRRVNDHQLTGLQKAFQIFQKAKTQSSISLELSRGGEMKELTFDLQ